MSTDALQLHGVGMTSVVDHEMLINSNNPTSSGILVDQRTLVGTPIDASVMGTTTTADGQSQQQLRVGGGQHHHSNNHHHSRNRNNNDSTQSLRVGGRRVSRRASMPAHIAQNLHGVGGGVGRSDVMDPNAMRYLPKILRDTYAQRQTRRPSLVSL